jgi:hypothetical protein
VLIDQQPHELGDRERGMRVVHLRREQVRQLLDGCALHFEQAEHVLE